jgi:recombination protein RecA
VLDAALARNVVAKRGSWLSFESEQIGQGSIAATEFLRNNPEVADRIIARIKDEPPAPAAIEKKGKEESTEE